MKRSPLRRISKKRAAYHASKEGKADLAYMGQVRRLPCVCCGKPGPNAAHHCRDIPPADQLGIYKRLPGAGMKSHARDAIPLCDPGCHKGGALSYHDHPGAWQAEYGQDYFYIAQTREAVAATS